MNLPQNVARRSKPKGIYRRFIVRDFKWNPEQLSEEKKKYAELVQAEKEQWVSLSFLQPDIIDSFMQSQFQ
jgi:hypothetical protein